MDLEIKEVTNFLEDNQNKAKIVFCQNDIEKEILFKGNGKIKTTVAEI